MEIWPLAINSRTLSRTIIGLLQVGQLHRFYTAEPPVNVRGVGRVLSVIMVIPNLSQVVNQ